MEGSLPISRALEEEVHALPSSHKCCWLIITYIFIKKGMSHYSCTSLQSICCSTATGWLLKARRLTSAEIQEHGACHLNVLLHWRSFPALARSLHCVLQKGSDKGVAGAKVHPCIFAALHSGSYCIYIGPFLGVMITSLVASKLLRTGGQ